jgi:hypothetical protein
MTSLGLGSWRLHTTACLLRFYCSSPVRSTLSASIVFPFFLSFPPNVVSVSISTCPYCCQHRLKRLPDSHPLPHPLATRLLAPRLFPFATSCSPVTLVFPFSHCQYFLMSRPMSSHYHEHKNLRRCITRCHLTRTLQRRNCHAATPRYITLIPSKVEPVTPLSICRPPFAWPWSIAMTFLGRQRVGLCHCCPPLHRTTTDDGTAIQTAHRPKRLGEP